MNEEYEKLLKISKANKANPYVDITAQELGIGFPTVSYNNFFPQNDELLIYVTPASTYVDKEKVIGYTGKSSGVNVRIAKGLSVRTGSSGGTPVRDTIRNYCSGDLIITNKRIVFAGQNDNFEYKLDKISTVKLLSKNSFFIQSGKTAKNIMVDESLTGYTFGYINFVINQAKEGNDIFTSIKEEQSKITPEQISTCEKIRIEAENINYTENIKKEKKKLSTPIKILLFLSIFILGIIFICISTNNTNTIDYTDKQIIYLNNHPKLYDNFEQTKEFYSNVDRKKVKIQDMSGGASSYYEQQKGYIIYMNNDSWNSQYIDTIDINLNNTDLSNMTLDEAIRIAVSYMPMDIFNEYYEVKRAFIYGNDSIITYHYAWQLNKNGINYKNNGNSYLSNDMGFKITHNKENNDFTIEINVFADDVSMAGGHDEEWFKKYTKVWNINPADYII